MTLSNDWVVGTPHVLSWQKYPDKDGYYWLRDEDNFLGVIQYANYEGQDEAYMAFWGADAQAKDILPVINIDVLKWRDNWECAYAEINFEDGQHYGNHNN
jgi:hypothetical protein